MRQLTIESQIKLDSKKRADPVFEAIWTRLLANPALAEADHTVSGELLDAVAPDFSNGQVVAFFKALQAIGIGQFIVGRYGYPSRFVWSRQAQVAGTSGPQASDAPGATAAAKPTTVPLQADVAISLQRVGEAVVTHQVIIRGKVKLSIELPIDLTASEAIKVAQYVLSCAAGRE